MSHKAALILAEPTTAGWPGWVDLGKRVYCWLIVFYHDYFMFLLHSRKTDMQQSVVLSFKCHLLVVVILVYFLIVIYFLYSFIFYIHLFLYLICSFVLYHWAVLISFLLYSDWLCAHSLLNILPARRRRGRRCCCCCCCCR